MFTENLSPEKPLNKIEGKTYNLLTEVIRESGLKVLRHHVWYLFEVTLGLALVVQFRYFALGKILIIFQESDKA